MKLKSFKEIKEYLICPVCGFDKAFSISHFTNGECSGFGPWYCDKCFHSIVGEVHGGIAEVELTDKMCIPTLVLLVYYKDMDKSQRMYLIVKGMRFTTGGKDDDGNQHYFYNEHTCPINYMRVEMVLEHEIIHNDEYDPGDTDPHGIFHFVASIDYNENIKKLEDCGNSHSVLKLFGI
jgi:hypothetical protein